jgi:hypothetical protein
VQRLRETEVSGADRHGQMPKSVVAAGKWGVRQNQGEGRGHQQRDTAYDLYLKEAL